MQWKVIRSIIYDKQDNCVVMATGIYILLTISISVVFLTLKFKTIFMQALVKVCAINFHLFSHME